MAVPASAPAPMLNDTRKSMLAGPRSEEVGFAHDSALEGAEFEPSVPGHDQLNCGAPPCSLPASDRGAGTGSVVQLALFCAANHSVEPGAGTALGVAVWIAARALARVLEDFPVRHRLLEPIEELRGRIDLVIVLALRKHRHLVEVFGEPRRGLGDMDEAVLDQRGVSLQTHDPLTTTAPLESVSACPKIVTLSKIVH